MRKYIKDLSKGTIDEILKLYSDSPVTTRFICEQYNISSGTLSRLVGMNNIARRCPSRCGTRSESNDKRKCRFCGNKNPSNAKFCCECGKPIYTDKELILIKLEELTKHFIVLQHANRDKYISQIQEIISMVKSLKVEQV